MVWPVINLVMFLSEIVVCPFIHSIIFWLVVEVCRDPILLKKIGFATF